MEEFAWVDTLHRKKVKEFILFPNAFTPLEKDVDIQLPEIELEGEEKKEESTTTEGTSTVKIITLTIGGFTIGTVMGVAGATALTPENACILSPTEEVSATTPAPLPSSPAVTPATSTPATGGGVAAPAATSTPAQATTSSSDGTAVGAR